MCSIYVVYVLVVCYTIQLFTCLPYIIILGCSLFLHHGSRSIVHLLLCYVCVYIYRVVLVARHFPANYYYYSLS